MLAATATVVALEGTAAGGRAGEAGTRDEGARTAQLRQILLVQ